jgi:hypothetical protein
MPMRADTVSALVVRSTTAFSLVTVSAASIQIGSSSSDATNDCGV